MDDLVWLCHPETGGINRFAAGALEMWIARGWELCDPPVENEDHLRDAAPSPTPESEEPAVELPHSGDGQDADTASTPESTSRARRGTTPKE